MHRLDNSLAGRISISRRIRQLGAESAIYGIAGALQKGIGFFLLPVYTYLFTPSDYGVISLVDIAATLFGIFATCGMGEAASRWYYITESEFDRRVTISTWFWAQLLLSLIGSALLFTASFFADGLLGDARYRPLLTLAAICLPVSTCQVVLKRWFQLRRQAQAAVFCAIGGVLLSISSIITFALPLNFGVTGVFVGRLFSAVIMMLITLRLMSHWLSPRPATRKRCIEMIKYGGPLLPAAIGIWVMFSADRYILKLFWTNHEVGLYGVAAKFSMGITLATTAFANAWGPFAFSIMKDHNARDTYARTLSVYTFLGGLGCAVLAAASGPALSILAPSSYAGAADCVAPLLFASMIGGMAQIAGIGARIANSTVPTAIAMGIGAVVNLLLSFALVPTYGIVGASIGTCLGFTAYVIYLFHASQRRYYIPFRWAETLLLTGVSIAIVAIPTVLPQLNSVTILAIQGVSTGIYLVVGALLGLFSVETLWRRISQFAQRAYACHVRWSCGE